MPKTVYMVASDKAREVFEDPERSWVSNRTAGSVIVDSVLDDAKWPARCDGWTLYRCEPISADEEPEPAPRTVKAYVAFDPKMEGGQDVWAYASVEQARVSCSRFPIFEIEMREVIPPPEKRETGWAIMGGPSGPLYGRGWYGAPLPFAFREKGAAEELAEMLGHGAVAVEVYRDTMEPVDAE